MNRAVLCSMYDVTDFFNSTSVNWSIQKKNNRDFSESWEIQHWYWPHVPHILPSLQASTGLSSTQFLKTMGVATSTFATLHILGAQRHSFSIQVSSMRFYKTLMLDETFEEIQFVQNELRFDTKACKKRHNIVSECNKLILLLHIITLNGVSVIVL